MNFYYIKYYVFSNICIFLSDITDDNAKKDIQSSMEKIQEEYERKEIITRNNVNFLTELNRIIVIKEIYSNKEFRNLYFSIMKCEDITLLKKINNKFEYINGIYFKGDYDKIYNYIDKNIKILNSRSYINKLKKNIIHFMTELSSDEESENLDESSDETNDEDTDESIDENTDENTEFDEQIDIEYIKNNNDSLIIKEEDVINQFTFYKSHTFSNLLIFLYACAVFMVFKNLSNI